MKNFNWNEFMNEKIVAYCDTKEKANDFLRECYSRGMAWISGNSLLNYNNWNIYKEDTCYRCNNFEISYSDLDYYKEKNYEIIEWEIEEKMKFNWSDFKQGKFVVEINDDNRQQFIKEIKKECKNMNNIHKWTYDCEYYCCNKNSIVYLFAKEINKPIINFMSNVNNKYELHITSDGIETNCVYKLNGKIINKSNAKLNPIDEFDFKEGVKICIDRVFENNIIKKGTKFRVVNVDKHSNNIFVCSHGYIGQTGTFNYDCDLNNPQKTLSSGTFEKEYINAIDKENRQLVWHQSEVEILED